MCVSQHVREVPFVMSVANRFRSSSPNIKNPWNFLFIVEALDNLQYKQESPRILP